MGWDETSDTDDDDDVWTSSVTFRVSSLSI